jgi:hypothetical protein
MEDFLVRIQYITAMRTLMALVSVPSGVIPDRWNRAGAPGHWARGIRFLDIIF